MKSFLASILLTLYFVVSSGFAVNLHYCMNKFHSWELGVSEKDKCGKCGMKSEKDNSCCRDEVKLVKLQQDTLSAKATVYFFGLPALAASTTPFLLQSFTITKQVDDFHLNGPPPIGSQDTYLKNCVFRL